MNWKYIGIEKEINEEFSLYKKTDLSILMDSSYFNNPLIRRREPGEFVEIEVISCNDSFWYKDLIGFTFFTRIRYKNYGNGKFMQEFIGVKLTNTKEILFRSFPAKDVIIL